MRRFRVCLAAAAAIGSPALAAAEPIDVTLELTPVANLQIAVWIERPDGTFVADVFVTETTGLRGLGNRPGRWDFLSSWRMVYGPRPQVLPVWAHRRGGEYPKIVFADEDPEHQETFGWHEESSSIEPYYCRPLTEEEHVTISVDTMTCPTPGGFQSDKGRFAAGETSVYPPRADLVDFENGADSPDAMMYAAMNDLDAITGATPPGDALFTLPVTVERNDGPLVAWIEVNLEHDENPDWDYEREDHFVDPLLSALGVEYFGQPSVVYRVEFDPAVPGRATATDMAGYGSFDGTSPGMNPVDATISVADGSGQDRLQVTMIDDAVFRFAVDVPPLEAGSTSGSDSGVTSGGVDSSVDSPPAEGDDGSVGEGSGSDSGGASVMDRGCACTSSTPAGSAAWWLALGFVLRRRSGWRDRGSRLVPGRRR